MIQEALEFLYDKFSDAEEARLLQIPGDGRKVFVDQGGKLTPMDVAPAVRSHKVNSVDDLTNAAHKWNTAPVVWIGSDAIVLIPDDGDRRDRVTLNLCKSAAFQRLICLDKQPLLDQQSLIRTLRIDLQGTVSRNELLTAIRSIKFRTTEGGASTIQQGNESLGHTIEAEVTGAGDIPESVIVSCAVFCNPGEREKKFQVGCDLEIVPAEKKFRFRPIPDEIERVTDAALEDIRQRIEGELDGVSVFYGSP